MYLEPPAEVIRKHLEAILNSPAFRAAKKASAFLDYVVRATLDGKEIKEYDIAIDALKENESFDPMQQGTVRATARQVRTKLREYYSSDGEQEAIRIELPSRTYNTIFHWAKQPTSPPHPPPFFTADPHSKEPSRDANWVMDLETMTPPLRTTLPDAPVGWPVVIRALEAVASDCRVYNPDLIIGILRGGGIVGGYLSRRMSTFAFRTVQKWDDSWQFSQSMPKMARRILVVDDAIRTGALSAWCRTTLKKRYPKAIIRVSVLIQSLLVRPSGSVPKADYYAYQSANNMLVFPWDMPIEEPVTE